MTLDRRDFIGLAAGAAAWAMPQTARAQPFPARPVTIIVPYPAGSPSDTVARIIGERMRGALGRPIILEDVSGAGGSLAVGRVARAAADGYTIGIGNFSTHVVNGATYALRYDLLNDLEPIGLLATNPFMITSRNSLPANDLKGLIAWLRANADKASQGTGGVGGASHVAGVFLQKMTGARFQIVPYRGVPPAMQDMIAGRIDLMIDQSSSVLAQWRAGTIRAYAVAAKTRMAAAPELPTVDEAGLPGLHMSLWYGFWAPKGTPNKAMATLNAASVEALADPSVQSQLANLGLEIFPRDQQTPEALRELQRTEIEKWWPIIREANIRGA